MPEIKIKDKTVKYTVVKRKVKYIRYEIQQDCSLKLVIPKRSKIDEKEYIHKKDDWIYKKITEHEESLEKTRNKITDEKIVTRTQDQLRSIVKEYININKEKLGVKVGRVQFRDLKNKWGSCSSLGNITLSKSLVYMPDELVEYIVYHELSHLLIMAHNDKFYKIIERKYPDYKKWDEKLSLYEYLISEI